MERKQSSREHAEISGQRNERGKNMVSFAITEGNPGALAFLMNAYDMDAFKAERGFQKMQDAGITGSRLYMLWNDCCGRNTGLAKLFHRKTPAGPVRKEAES
jgi:hypothetical protein